MVPGVPRLGPGFQVKILMRFCANSPSCLLESNLSSDGEEKRFLMRVLPNTAFNCHVAGACSGWVGFHPRCVVISSGRGIIIEGRENLDVRAM